MNEKLEQLSFEMFPEIWEHIDSNILGYERDVNYEQRQKWLEDAKKIYNLALADVKEELEVQDEKYRTMRVSKESTIQQAREADLVVYVLHGLNNFVDRLTK